MSAPDPRVLRQLRHDVDDVYGVVDATNQTVAAIAATQRRHSTRLEEIQQTLDLQSGQLQRLDDLQRVVEAQGGRLDEQSGLLAAQGGRLDEQSGHLERIEDLQLQILDLLRTGPEADGPGTSGG